MSVDRLIRDAQGNIVTADVILRAYEARCFPMADERHGPINWYRPQERAVITWDHFKVPRSLKKVAAKRPYRLSFNEAFADVIASCADREETWISKDIQALYCSLHEYGIAQSVEAWDENEVLVGGLYGLCIGSCFCGESMFFKKPDASKLCVIALVERLQRSGFVMLDCQQQTPHMQRFGARLMSDRVYAALLYRDLEQRPF